MKHKLLNTLLLIFMGFLRLSAQEGGCATEGGEAFVQKMLQDRELLNRFEAEFLRVPDLRTVTNVSLPVQFHVVRSSAGVSSLTSGTLNQAVIILNNYFQNAGLQFYQCAQPRYIDDSNLTNYFISQQNQLVEKSYVKNVINVYCVASIEGGGVGGYTFLPGSGQPDLIVMDDGLMLNATLSHEMGHFFGLLHTHGASNCPSRLPGTDELVDGSNCSEAGDFVCDTPADPGLLGAGCLEYQVDQSCAYVGTSRDARGQAFNPDPQNVMSYSRPSCRNRMSLGQYARINATFRQYRSYLTCSEPVSVTRRLSLNAPVFFSPNPIRAGKAFSLTTQVVNTGNAGFTGKVRATLFNRQDQEIATIDTKSITETLAPGAALPGLLEFSNPNLLLGQETYKVGIFFLPDSASTYQLAGNEKFASYVTFVVEGAPVVCDPPDSVWVADAGVSHLAFEWTSSVIQAAYYKIAYREQGKTIWTEVPNWSANRVVIVNRKPCTGYEFRVKTVCPEGESEWSPVLGIATGGCNAVYCLSYGNALRSYIQEVSIGNLTHVSGNNYGYKDFTHLRAEGSPGSFLAFNLVPGMISGESIRTVYWRVWVDLNRDRDFDDPGEMRFQGTDLNNRKISAAWQVPDTLKPGETRIRISMDTRAYPTPCATNDYRDVEDYTLVIGGLVSLQIDPTFMEFPAEAGSRTLSLASDLSWVAETPDSWIQVSPKNGIAGTHSPGIGVSENPQVLSRTGSVVFRAGSSSKTLAIRQLGRLVSVDELVFSPAGGLKNLLINADTSWVLKEKPSWITKVTPTQGSKSGSGAVSVELTCAANPEEVVRNGKLIFQWANGRTAQVSVKQEPNSAPNSWALTPTGSDHLILLPPDLKGVIGEQKLQAGDYIGFFFFDGKQEKCAGFSRWTGEFNTLTVYGDDGSTTPLKEGFAVGELLQARVWQLSTQKEWKMPAHFAPVTGFSLHTHTHKFAPNGISLLLGLEEHPSSLYTLYLKEGFDLFSLPLVPDNADVLAMFDQVKGDLEEVQNGVGAKAIPASGLNAIGDFDVRQGYVGKAKKGIQVEVAGRLVQPSLYPIGVQKGWQIIPFWSTTPRPVTEALAGISGKVLLVKDLEGRSYIPAYRINTIGNFLPGKAYWLLASGSDTLRYPDAFMQSPLTELNFSPIALEAPEYFRMERAAGLEPSATLVFLAEGISTLLSPEDEIGVFTLQGRLAGTGVYHGENLAITVWGMEPGEEYAIRVWKRNEQRAFSVKVIFRDGHKESFAPGTLSVVDRLEELATSVEPVLFAGNIQVYPNPARDEITLQVPGGFPPGSLLRLIRSDGQVIRTMALSNDAVQEISLRGLSPGPYMIQIQHTKGARFFHKIVKAE